MQARLLAVPAVRSLCPFLFPLRWLFCPALVLFVSLQMFHFFITLSVTVRKQHSPVTYQSPTVIELDTLSSVTLWNRDPLWVGHALLLDAVSLAREPHVPLPHLHPLWSRSNLWPPVRTPRGITGLVTHSCAHITFSVACHF